MNVLFDFKKIEKISNALADPNRIVIIEAIRTRSDWMNLFEIVKLSQPTISHHLKVLKDAGLIVPEKFGRKIKYTINKDVFSSFAQYLTGYGK